MLSPSGPGALSAKLIRRVRLVKSARWLGGFVIMLSISTVSVDGLKLIKFAPWITVSGSSRNMDIKIDVAS